MTNDVGQTTILATVPEAPRLRFLPITPELARAAESEEAFAKATASSLGKLGETVRDVIKQSEAMRVRTGAPISWGSFLVCDRAANVACGTCSFTNAPDANGAVEIAYFTFAGFEKRGIATAMARFLVDYARARHDAKIVYAHTLPKESPSTKVMRRLGFSARGTAQDPDAGEVWRFELALEREDEARIFRMERAALLRWCAGDPSGFLEICAADVSYFDPYVQKRIDGLPALTEYYEAMRGKIRAERFEIARPRVHKTRDLSVLTFNFTSFRNEGADVASLTWNATEIFRRDTDGLRIIHTHWSLTPRSS